MKRERIGELCFSKLACHRLRGKGDHEVAEGGACGAVAGC